MQRLLGFSVFGAENFNLTANLTNLNVEINLPFHAGLGGIICTISEPFLQETTFRSPFRKINLVLADVHRARFPSLGLTPEIH